MHAEQTCYHTPTCTEHTAEMRVIKELANRFVEASPSAHADIETQ
jgi:hypothetical protein